ncbi:glutathione synthase [Cocleimonas sp. KMM 6892]|uniref:glutathione synthase n=1 Tax=unclassified Cocleimonas TaxID=2639732 RepID=UPI002DBCB795|nr:MULTISPECIES: glutathione synthase [unclassified Cocleimonas]MEB8431288.1 glutathione synthase [Cocleimonas sp. KMM 6892]MEC4713940.1 glutathione synthase [Cocleimonas sp. KMM 6895]MEC4743271.1 glutathione synthase [Cocleimonas sp. KMM 6896]
MQNQISLGVVMDPIHLINIKKDSSFAMMLEAQRRDYSVYYITQKDMYVKEGVAYANMAKITVTDNPDSWYELEEPSDRPLHELSCIIMRKDPPFDMEYIYSTYILELAEQHGCLVVNKPSSIRTANEKLFTAWFPEFSPETLVTRDMERIKAFHEALKRIVVKPLDGMGGSMVFQIQEGDANRSVILETITNNGTQTVMAQRFLPEFKNGDKRILVINGKPFPHGLARIPAKGESRGNLAAGASYKGVDLTEREFEICNAVGPKLKDMGLMFVGLDVIGDYVTEINVTSPTCIRELDAIYSANISGLLMDEIENSLKENLQ